MGVGKAIRMELIRLDLKQSDLATRMHKSEMWISRRLRGAQPIDLNDLQEFADALGIRPERLVAGAVVSSTAGAGQTTVPTLETPIRTTPIGHPKRAVPPASSRRPARLVPQIPELMTDDVMAELLDSAAA
jgi:transcriptional regulator with XRE-family HTH domain